MIKKIKNTKGNEALIFAETFEPEAYEQIKTLVNYEAYENEKIRIMPDAHAGKGCTVGTTMTITNKITPNLVGVDIGCGMLTIKLSDKDIDFEKLDRIINKFIPSGFNIHQDVKKEFNFSKLICKDSVDLDRAKLSIGSLGGGNHFIELSKSENDKYLYLIIHSGSRKLGGDTCKYYQSKALKNLTSKSVSIKKTIEKLKKEGRENEISKELKKIKTPIINKDLAFLSGNDFNDYMNDMIIVQKFAEENRNVIADIIIKECGLSEIERFQTIHNYIDFETMILRKGAVSAKDGELLLIPINMRDGSLLCTGKGNPDWNFSAPHGAGRLMSRTKAKKLININDFEKSMDNIYSSSISESTLDEAPQAYKSIEEIKNAITETVNIIDILKPVYNFKAH